MTTYWNIHVDVDGVTKCSTGGKTASDAIERALQDAIYYQAIYPAAKVVLAGIVEFCGKCSGEGEILKKPSSVFGRMVKCPECKGKPPTGRMDPITLTLPDASNKVRIIQEAE